MAYEVDFKKKSRELKKQRECDAKQVVLHDNKYGYTLNIANSVLRVVYDDFKHHFRINGGLSDWQRLNFEKHIKKYLIKRYKEVYNQNLYSPVMGFQEERLEALVQVLTPAEIEDYLFKNYSKEVAKRGNKL